MFFKQSKLSAFWYRSSDNDRKLHYFIKKGIIEVIIGDMLFDKKNDGDSKNGKSSDGLLPGDLAMKAL